MEIFKEKIKFNNFGEIYFGLKKEWIYPKEILRFCESSYIKSCNEKRLIELYLALDESLIHFLEKLKLFIIEDGLSIISKNEDESEKDFNYIPKVYKSIWELEFLLRVKNSNKEMDEKFDILIRTFHEFNFPDEWRVFIPYDPNSKSATGGQSGVYNNFIVYVNGRIEYFQNLGSLADEGFQPETLDKE